MLMPESPVASEHEASRIRERFERLLAAGVSIFSRHDLDHVLQEVVEAARAVVGARYAALGVLSADGQSLVQFVPPASKTAPPQPRGAPPGGRALPAQVTQEPKPIRTADINQ